MSRRARLYSLIGLGLIMMLAMAFLTLGNTWRMFRANRYYNKGENELAQERYEDLLVDLPNSPYVQHNLGLSSLRNGQVEKAGASLLEAAGGLEGLKLRKSRRNKLKNEFYYNLGIAQSDWGVKSEDPQISQSKCQEALQSFRQAIEADPKDMDAKYNYELTLLRLKQPPSERSSQQQQNEAENIMNMNDAQYFIPRIREEEPVAKDW